uniref:PARP4 MVP-ID C-terminal domain-containing protein n=1 Tax=Sinocyclocheilus anshuiensis TaxID=1608454 RepID=A0A671NRJ5_9TELE
MKLHTVPLSPRLPLFLLTLFSLVNLQFPSMLLACQMRLHMGALLVFCKRQLSLNSIVVSQFLLRGKMALSFRGKQISRPHTVAWNELFELQHEDGYWECTDRLSSFLNLDVDFFANVFLKEKGIRSFGVKAHADILRLVATLLVLQLIRVKKLAVGQLLESLLRLKESQEPRYQHTPMYWEAVKRAVAWACRTDRQYPCVCSRLEIGRDWESSTRQLLGCDSPHPYSPLKPVLERRTGVSVM